MVLHVGDGKCGSSSIQSALWQSSAELEAKGILYRARNRNNGHFAFVALAGATTRGNDEENRARSIENIENLRNRLSEGGISCIILSAESFFKRTPSDVLRLVDMISPDIDGVDVVAYVREPAEMYVSWMQQTLKGSHLIVRPEVYHHPVDEFLLPWLSTPGVDSVTVRPFVRSLLAGGSVVQDFAMIVERLTGQPMHLSEFAENSSLTAEQVFALQRFRSGHLKLSNGKRSNASDRLIALFQQINTLMPVGSKPKLQARWVNRIRANSASTFRDLATAFPDCEILRKPFDNQSDPPPPSRAQDVRTVIEPFDDELARLLLGVARPPQVFAGGEMPDHARKCLRVLERKRGMDISKTAPLVAKYWAASLVAEAA